MGDFYNTQDDQDVSTDAPISRRVGIEVELDGTTQLAERLINNRLAPPALNDDPYDPYNEDCDEECCGDPDCCEPCTSCANEYSDEYGDYFFHGDHCSCSEQDDYPIHICVDCSAPAGEFKIGGSTGVLYGSSNYYEAIDMLTRNAQACPDISVTNAVGSHVHVDRLDVYPRDVARFASTFDDELEILAAGDLDSLRSNRYMNGLVAFTERYGNWNTTSLRGGVGVPTIEFRFWNSTTNPVLIDMNAGVSAAIVEAVSAGREPERTLLGTIEPFITDIVRDTVADKLSNHGQIIATTTPSRVTA